METTMNELMAYLRRNRAVLNISEIGREIGFKNLLAAVNGNKSGNGYETKLPERCLPKLAEVINELRK